METFLYRDVRNGVHYDILYPHWVISWKYSFLEMGGRHVFNVPYTASLILLFSLFSNGKTALKYLTMKVINDTFDTHCIGMCFRYSLNAITSIIYSSFTFTFTLSILSNTDIFFTETVMSINTYICKRDNSILHQDFHYMYVIDIS